MPTIKPEELATLIDAGRRMYEGGLATGALGAIAVRLPKDVVAVTAAGSRLGYLNRDDLLLINGAGPVAENGRQPGKETGVLRAVLAAQPEAGSVVRVQGPYTTALAHKGRKAIERSRGLMEELGGVAFVPFYRPGTAGLAGAIAEVLRANRVAIVEGQGAVVWGTDVHDAVDHAEALEAAARLSFILNGNEA